MSKVSETASLDDLTLESLNEAPESAAAPPSSPPPEAPTPSDPAAPAPDPPVPASASAPAAPSTPTGTPNTTEPTVWQPPTGQPFAFRLDGQDISPDGVIHANGHVIWPEASWQSFSAGIGNRQLWAQKEAGYRRTIQEHQAKLASAEQPGKVAVMAWNSLVQEATQDPAKLVERLDQVIADLPNRQLRAELQLRQQAETQRQQEEQETQQSRERQELDQGLSGFLGDRVKDALTHPDFKVLQEVGEEVGSVARDIIERHALEIFQAVEPDQVNYHTQTGWQVLTQANGKFVCYNPRNLHALLKTRADRIGGYVQTQRQKLEAAMQAEQRNKATVTPTPPPVTSTAPAVKRDEQGRFKEVDKAEQRRQAKRAWQDLSPQDLAD